MRSSVHLRVFCVVCVNLVGRNYSDSKTYLVFIFIAYVTTLYHSFSVPRMKLSLYTCTLFYRLSHSDVSPSIVPLLFIFYNLNHVLLLFTCLGYFLPNRNQIFTIARNIDINSNIRDEMHVLRNSHDFGSWKGKI